tara:strand:+ start:43 stop:216 length:174 start_codon:yes stop_codon:yes gene_type:complete
MPKKGKVTYVKQTTDRDKIQIDIKKSLDDDKKINPNKIFEKKTDKRTKKKRKQKKKY